MPDDLHFRSDLYRGTAVDYERFRIGYPRALVEDLARRTEATGHGRLLDLACGTGQLLFALAGSFDETWAVDLEPGMLAQVRANAVAAGISRVHTEVSAAEDLLAPQHRFDLVTVGNAFHRVRREQVGANVAGWLRPGGYLALVWSDSPWVGGLPWQVRLSEILRRWTAAVGATDRVPAGWARARAERPDAQVLGEAGFEPSGRYRFTAEHCWSIETLVGFVYSTSFLPRHALAERGAEFEAEVGRELDPISGSSELVQEIAYDYELFRRAH